MFDKISIDSKEYPEKLKEIANPPKELYYIGDIGLLATDSIAMVGTRTPSIYGKKMAHEFGLSLALAGVTIVSGMARGIDGASHKAALEAGGATIAVLGCAINEVYPPEHDKLYDEIARKGLIISEYAPSTPPLPAYFPQRNRIISGLARAALIIECGKKSGTMSTFAECKKQGRDVYVIPTNLDNINGDGNIQLLKKGANLATTPNDLLLNKKAKPASKKRTPAKLESDLADVQSIILEKLGNSKVWTIDELALELALPVATLSYQLLLLEFQGFVNKVGNGYANNC